MADEISIVGGGFSVRNHDLNKIPGTVICVNDAAFHSPRCDIIVSMDRLWTEHRLDDLERLRLPSYIRLRAMINHLDRLHQKWLWPFENRHDTADFGLHRVTLNGPNSGHCALNLAFVMHPKRISLYGFDMGRGPNGEVYWFPPYPWVQPQGATSNKRYGEWESALAHGIEQCKAVGIEVVRYN